MIVFVHLNNDFSGSPKILRDVLSIAYENSIPSKLYVSSSSRTGFLSNTEVGVNTFWYRRYKNKLLVLMALCFSQFHLFLKLLCDKDIRSDSVIYVNALLPFGANLYALVTHKKLICHIHEISITPPLLYKFLIKLNQMSSNQNIFVSNEQLKLMGLLEVPSLAIPNALDDDLLERGALSKYFHTIQNNFVVLMVSSPSRYKGIPEFIELANLLALNESKIVFKLVLNCSLNEMPSSLDKCNLPSNVKVYPVSSDVGEYYSGASILLNLSRPDMWIETFGLTILEAMAFGLPVIVPQVGGPKDFVTDGVEGYLLDCRDIESVAGAIVNLYKNSDIHQEMSVAAQKKASLYGRYDFDRKILSVLQSV